MREPKDRLEGRTATYVKRLIAIPSTTDALLMVSAASKGRNVFEVATAKRAFVVDVAVKRWFPMVAATFSRPGFVSHTGTDQTNEIADDIRSLLACASPSARAENHARACCLLRYTCGQNLKRSRSMSRRNIDAGRDRC